MVIEVTDGYARFDRPLRTVENYATPTIGHYASNGHACLVIFAPRKYRKMAQVIARLETAVGTFVANGRSMVFDCAT